MNNGDARDDSPTLLWVCAFMVKGGSFVLREVSKASLGPHPRQETTAHFARRHGGVAEISATGALLALAWRKNAPP